MKKLVLPLLFAVFSASLYAQQDVYAITGKSLSQILFKDLRTVSLDNHRETLFLEANTNISVYSQTLKKNIVEAKNTVHQAQSNGIAALAFDGKSLIYTPMFSSNIYVLDTKTNAITLLENQVIQTKQCDVSTQITRMALASDGNVYATSNSGSQLIQISNKNGKYSVKDLGSITPISDNSLAISEMKNGFGGDMIADAKGNLFIISASANIFKISIKNLSSEFIGKIKNLPENFSVNGAAVDNDGNIILASAKGGDFYQFSMDEMSAVAKANHQNLPIYDLASSHFLQDKRNVSNPVFAGIEVFPTNVDKGFVNIKIGNEIKETVLVEFYNAAGNKVLNNEVRNNQINRIDTSSLTSGMYIVNLTTQSGKKLYAAKILVK